MVFTKYIVLNQLHGNFTKINLFALNHHKYQLIEVKTIAFIYTYYVTKKHNFGQTIWSPVAFSRYFLNKLVC